MEFFEKVLFVRMTLDISQETLARELGISYPTVHRWEKNMCKPSMLALNKFNKYCEKNQISFPNSRND